MFLDEIFQRRTAGRFRQARIFMLVPIETSRSWHVCQCRFVTHCLSMCLLFVRVLVCVGNPFH